MHRQTPPRPRERLPAPLATPLATRRASRRATLVAVAGLGVGAAGAAGCAPRGPGTATGAVAASSGEDEVLVAAVLVELSVVAALVASAGRAAPDLRSALRPLSRLHRAHARALDGSLDPADPAGPADPVPGTEVADSRDRVLDQVRAREQRLQRRLVGWAVDADSGALARLLGSMSAGLSQRLALLPGPGPVDGGAS